MPRTLALETSGRSGSIALAEGGEILAEDAFPHGLRHAANLIPAIDALCRGVGWTPRDIRRVCVSVGPGSFTGLRVGVTLAKTLAFATGAQIVAVPSLRTLAENAPADARHVLCAIDAGRGNVFAARYERDGEEWIEREPVRQEPLADALARAPRPLWLLGDAVGSHADAIPAAPDLHKTPPDLWINRAAAVASVGAAMASRGEFADPFALTPLYVRRPGPEEKRLAAASKTPSDTREPRAHAD